MSDLAARTKLDASAVSHIARLLEADGYLERDPAKQFFEGIMRDKGYGRGLTKFGEARKPKGIEHE